MRIPKSGTPRKAAGLKVPFTCHSDGSTLLTVPEQSRTVRMTRLGDFRGSEARNLPLLFFRQKQIPRRSRGDLLGMTGWVTGATTGNT
jgi:hypothetical protein